MKVYAPVKDFNGLRNNVRFVNGVGETNDPKLIQWFVERGYKVDGEITNELPNYVGHVDETMINQALEEVELMDIPDKEEAEPNLDEMTPNEIREYMKEIGLGREMKNIRSKDKLIEIINKSRG